MDILVKIVVASILLSAGTLRAETRLGYFMIGPVLHWNFSGNGFTAFSSGVEASWWTYERDLEGNGFFSNMPKAESGGYGLDFGFEIDRKAVRMYAEPQLGWVLAGLSLGPVLELSREGGPVQVGFQGSGWLNALAGVDFRYRRMGGRHHQAVGTYFKLGALVSGRDG